MITGRRNSSTNSYPAINKKWLLGRLYGRVELHAGERGVDSGPERADGEAGDGGALAAEFCGKGGPAARGGRLGVGQNR